MNEMTQTKAKSKVKTKQNRKVQSPRKKTTAPVKKTASAGLVSLDIRKAYKNRLVNEYFQRPH